MRFLFYFHLLRFFFISFLLTQKGASLSKNGTFFKRVQTEIVLKYVWHWHSWTSIGKLRSNWTISIKKIIYWIIKNSRSFDFFGLTKRPDLSLWRLLVSKMFHFSMTMQNAPYHTYQYDIPLKSWWSFLHWIIIFHHLKKKKNLRKRNRTFSCAWCAVCSFR